MANPPAGADPGEAGWMAPPLGLNIRFATIFYVIRGLIQGKKQDNH
jgi:hypothetical protein